MNFPRHFWTLLAIGALSMGPAASASPKDDVAAEVTWYDARTWPDVRGKPYVEVTLPVSRAGIRWQPRRTIRGFLLDEDDFAFRLFCDGATRRILKSPRPGTSDLPATARELGPTEAVDTEIKELRREKAAPAQIMFGGSPPTIPQEWIPPEDVRTYLHFFVLARCFARQTRTDLAEKLDHELAVLLAKTPAKVVESWLSKIALIGTVNDFGDPGVSRPELLRQCERLAHDFSSVGHPDVVAGILEQVRAMVQEDEAHAKSTTPPFESLSDAEKAQELIFRLRDESGLQKCRLLVPDFWETHAFLEGPLAPGSLTVRTPLGPLGTVDSPAHQLIRLGPSAVPALIAALGDQRPSRSVEPRPEAQGNPWDAILTIADCAETILFYISGQHFVADSDCSRFQSKKVRTDAVRTRAERWWRERQERGEIAVLIEGVRAGGKDSLEQARHLAALDPIAGVQALFAGVSTTHSGDRRIDLIREMATIPGEAATQALRDIMANGADLNDRVSAAAGLWQRGQKDVVAAMIREWEQWGPDVHRDKSGDPQQLIDLLASCGEVAALDALDRRYAALPIETKFLLLDSGPQSVYFTAEADRKPLSAEFEALREELLVKALDDTTRHEFGYHGVRRDVSLHSARACDLAACTLADLWPARYEFQGGFTHFERDAQIAKMRNAWRVAHGLADLPLRAPVTHAVEGLADDRNVVVACQWSGGPSLPTVPIAIGKPLTPADFTGTARELHEHLPPGCIGFILSAERARNQSGIVVEIEWTPGPFPKAPTVEVFCCALWFAQGVTMNVGIDDANKITLPNHDTRGGMIQHCTQSKCHRASFDRVSLALGTATEVSVAARAVPSGGLFFIIMFFIFFFSGKEHE